MSRVCISAGGFMFEAEGEDSFIETQVDKFIGKEGKKLIENYISNELGIIVTEKKRVLQKNQTANLQSREPEEEFSYPSFRALKRKQIIKFDWEWVLISAFKVTNEGSDQKATDEIRNKLKEETLYTRSFSKNYARNIDKLEVERYIDRYAGDEFMLTDDGINKAKEILSR